MGTQLSRTCDQMKNQMKLQTNHQINTFIVYRQKILFCAFGLFDTLEIFYFLVLFSVSLQCLDEIDIDKLVKTPKQEWSIILIARVSNHFTLNPAVKSSNTFHLMMFLEKLFIPTNINLNTWTALFFSLNMMQRYDWKTAAMGFPMLTKYLFSLAFGKQKFRPKVGKSVHVP